MKFLFGDIVVVEGNLIGVVVKSWREELYSSITKRFKYKYKYEIYVREYNEILEYEERQIDRYRVRHKYLNEEEMEYQNSL